ncbi:nucleoporin SEH1 isoform X1 [Hydra vulgaris]|nr:nucleoporin SEH1 [Hydra vulgaris]
MYTTRLISADHKDIIHDVSFDFYGRRMATCSSDHTVKIWDIDEHGEWVCTADWKTHSGSVWKVTWAHPEFGQVIATCSFDRTAVVWEEQVGEASSVQIGRTSQWIQRASLVDSSNSVTDIKFSPKHLGLLLAMCYKDGVVRIYEATDVMNLSHWSVQHVINCKITSASSISWNPSRAHAPMLAVGSDDTSPNAGGKVEIHEYNNNARKWMKVGTLMSVTEAVHDVAFAPNIGRTHHLLAIASKDVYIMSIKPSKEKMTQSTSGTLVVDKPEISQLALLHDHEAPVWRVEWNLTGTILSSTGDDGRVRIWKANYLGNWTCLADMQGDNGNSSKKTAHIPMKKHPISIDFNSIQSTKGTY